MLVRYRFGVLLGCLLSAGCGGSTQIVNGRVSESVETMPEVQVSVVAETTSEPQVEVPVEDYSKWNMVFVPVQAGLPQTADSAPVVYDRRNRQVLLGGQVYSFVVEEGYDESVAGLSTDLYRNAAGTYVKLAEFDEPFFLDNPGSDGRFSAGTFIYQTLDEDLAVTSFGYGGINYDNDLPTSGVGEYRGRVLQEVRLKPEDEMRLERDFFVANVDFALGLVSAEVDVDRASEFDKFRFEAAALTTEGFQGGELVMLERDTDVTKDVLSGSQVDSFQGQLFAETIVLDNVPRRERPVGSVAGAFLIDDSANGGIFISGVFAGD